MAYRFTRSESTRENIQRVIAEQIDNAEQELTATDNRLDGIHEARKSFKRIRGGLRLVRPLLGDVYQRENRRFRDAGRRFSWVRDAEALIETLDQLCDQQREQVDVAAFEPLRHALVERCDQIIGDTNDIDERVSVVLAEMAAARKQLDAWPAFPADSGAHGGGLKRSYKRGRKEMQQAYAEPSVEAFHQWRKRVKYSWYHIRLLRDIWPPMMQGYRDELKRLAGILGDDHDLAVLHEHIAAEPRLLAKQGDRLELINIIGRQQEQLRREAWYLGRRIYAPRPRAFRQNIVQYWETWQAEDRLVPAESAA
jgi:CHAD domain-containing protein